MIEVFYRFSQMEEIAEALGIAILMGGGPALTYSAFAAQAMEDFAPKV